MRILITAGPTREPIDAVRFVSNRSSGRMGLAIAAAAVAAGHATTLLMGPGPSAEEMPAGCRVYRFESSAELKQVLEAHWPDHDVLIMAAAVADYRPACVAEGKLPRDPSQPLILRLEPTPDLVALMAQRKRPQQRIVAFALEEVDTLEQRAAAKMKRKGVDAIVANPLGTMESDSVTAIWLAADGTRLAPGRMTKAAWADWLVKQVEKLQATRQAR
jgi:phosphopantothenoylcysteine decarboxylase/phosphopantothenate--cysteine ligase